MKITKIEYTTTLTHNRSDKINFYSYDVYIGSYYLMSKKIILNDRNRVEEINQYLRERDFEIVEKSSL